MHNHSMYEEIRNHRMNTLFHARFKRAVQLVCEAHNCIVSVPLIFPSPLNQKAIVHAQEPANRPERGNTGTPCFHHRALFPITPDNASREAALIQIPANIL